MEDKIKISELNPIAQTDLKEDAVFPISQDNETYKASISQVMQKVSDSQDEKYLKKSEKIPNENLNFGEVKEGDDRAVSGGEVYNNTKDVKELNNFNINILNQERLASNRTIIYKENPNRLIRFLNIYSPLNGKVLVFKATKDGNDFTILESKEIVTDNKTYSYYINLNLDENEFIGVNFIDYGYVIQSNTTQGTFFTLNGNVNEGSTYAFVDVGEFAKISFSYYPNNEQLVIRNKNIIDSNLLNVPYINKYLNNTNDSRKPSRSIFIIDKVYYKNTVINYIKIHKPTNGVVLVLNVKKNLDNTFSVVNYFRLETNSKKDTYKISIQVDANNYLGAYFSDAGYVVDVSSSSGNYEKVLEYVGDPTLGAFSPISTASKVKVSFKEDFYLKDKVENISNIIPFENAILNIQDTSQKRFRLGEPIYLEDPYGYNQFLHPNVRYFKDGWNRYKYWMSVTPMPMDGELYADRYENPCIYVSNDAINWYVMQGAVNPIDDLTEQNISNKDYMSDPCLVYRDDLNRLECWYRITYAKENLKTLILRKHTTDGVNWSEREVMVDTSEYHMIRSQAMRWDNVSEKYRMWYTGGEGGSIVSYNESSDGKIWDNYQKCTGVLSCWHLDIEIMNGEYYLLNYELNNNLGINQLRLHKSIDGINFDEGLVVLKPEICTWYAGGLYKSTLVYNGKDWIMYFSGETNRRYIGIATGNDPFKLNVLNGGYVVGAKKYEGNLEIITTNVRNGSLSFGKLFNLILNNGIKQLVLNQIKGIIKF